MASLASQARDLTPADYNPLDPAVRADPYPYYAVLRREAPVHRIRPGVPFFAVTRHEHVTEVIHAPETYSSTALQILGQGGGISMSPNSDALAGHRLLASPMMIAVDQAPPGACLTIPAGTCVTVYMLHFDVTTPSSARGRLALTVPILGVISTQLLLDQTNDMLGNHDEARPTRYPTPTQCQAAPPGSGSCGLESNDAIDLQPRSIEVELHANGPGDRVRVIAACDA